MLKTDYFLYTVKKVLIMVKRNKIPTIRFKSEYWKPEKVIARIPIREAVHRIYIIIVKNLFTSPTS